MSARKQHEIWIEQCGAAETIKARFGLKAAFDYVVGEKLLNFASAATQHPEFARELPRFVSEVRRMFTPEEIRIHTARLERPWLLARLVEKIQPLIRREGTLMLEKK